MEIGKTLSVSDRAEWRAWLAKHFQTEPEIWLVFPKKSSGQARLLYNDAVEEALCFGWIDSIVRTIDERRYMQKFTPRKPGSKWSPSNKARVEKLIGEGAMTRAGLAAIEAAKKDGRWNAGDDRRVTEMPAELGAALRQDARAAKTFAALPPSHQKAYVRWVGSAKRAPTRERRASEARAMLREGKPLGMK
jgi:uncharacterized protein YdeI (YjbR/CyaY-like superfamily)